MTDRPILFSGAMVEALLAGRKTQTRRVLKPEIETGARFAGVERDGSWLFTKGCAYGRIRPKFVIGDRLYVRESYYQRGNWAPVTPRPRGSTEREKWQFIPEGDPTFDVPAEFRSARQRDDPWTVAWHKRLGRFMPRAYSRMTLIVTDVRVERLQDISVADAVAEGIEDVTSDVASSDKSLRFWRRYRDGGWNAYIDSAIGSYASLWTEINGPGSWEVNPWVSAITFSVEHRNIDHV